MEADPAITIVATLLLLLLLLLQLLVVLFSSLGNECLCWNISSVARD